MKKVERWKMEMPTEEEMLPKDKYSVFDRKVKRYRKGIHSTSGSGGVVSGEQNANVQQRYRSGRGSARDSILLVSRRSVGYRVYIICHYTFASDSAHGRTNNAYFEQ
jgi:hypothetical protein